MRRTSRIVSVVAAVAVAAGAGIVTAPAAGAATNPHILSVAPVSGNANDPCTANGSATIYDGANGGAGAVASAMTGSAGESFQIVNYCGTSLTLYWDGSTADSTVLPSWGTPPNTTSPSIESYTLPVGVSSFNFKVGGTYVTTNTVMVSSPPAPAPDATAGSSGSVPAPAVLTLDVNAAAGGASCKEGSSLVGYTGEWLTLPGSGDCTLPSKPGAVLLGWSTSADFPIAIAQRQASNKWGTYELTDDAGNITATFIPAGWQTFVSGANTLHPIWSS